jgi:16S rRNA (cytidine1402-2'-O)-methyltransferase
MEDEGPKKGNLYIVATPIGNLEDITLRALRILKTVSLIAAEDTRHSRVLLRAYDIRTPVTSLYDHIEAQKSTSLVARMLDGHDVAYVSDAGTPGISDPGYILINAAITHGIPVVPIPGVSAVITALCASGLPMGAFAFQSFLPSKGSQRREVLQSLACETRTLIFYESPNRLKATLEDIGAIFGRRRIVVARELTKLYEEFLRGDVDELTEMFRDRTVKGEITIVIAGAEKREPQYSDDDIRQRLARLEATGDLPLRGRIDHVAHETGLPRRRVYQLALEGKDREQEGDK